MGLVAEIPIDTASWIWACFFPSRLPKTWGTGLDYDSIIWMAWSWDIKLGIIIILMTPKQWMVSLSSLMFMLNKRVTASSPDLFPSVNTNQNCHRERRTPQFPEDYYDWWYCKLLRGQGGPFQLHQKGSVSPNSAFSIQFQHETQMKRQSLSPESSRATTWPSSQQYPKEGLLETRQKLSRTVGSNDYFLLL